MQITFKGRHIEITDALRTTVTEKLSRLSRHFPSIISIDVTLGVEKLEQWAEAQVHVPGTHLQASAQSKDLYEAIDLLYEKLKKLVDKHKDKLKDHH